MVATSGVLRIGLAQINPTVGDLAGNVELIVNAYRDARSRDCDVVAFPELCISGYPPEDLVLKAGFVADNRAAMRGFAEQTGDCVAVLGFVDVDHQGRLFNAAAVCQGGEVRGTYFKQILPNYGVFDEERYFSSGLDDSGSTTLFQIGGVVVGITVCEDIWIADGPVRSQALAGAVLNININASPYHRGKIGQRQQMLSERAKDNHCAIAYVNQIGGQDELVFDGGSMMFSADGSLISRSPQFVDDLLVTDLELPASGTEIHPGVIEVSSRGKTHSSAVIPSISPRCSDFEELYGALVTGVRDYVKKNGFSDVVIGLSGGVDSALVAVLATEALGAEHVHGVSMPSRYSSAGSRTDAAQLAGNLGIELQTISIEPAFQAYLEMYASSFAEKPADLTEENLQSRIRGTTLMALSNKFGWMVLTTGNKSELAVGYFTLYGDSVGGFAVIKDLFKSTVYELCNHINLRANREVIPHGIISKPPSAELRPDQRDDQSLPPYDVLDAILDLYVEDDRTATEIIALGHEAQLVRRVARLVDMNEYKRRQGPPGVRVTMKAFGKDRRLPITNAYRG
ncbi:MAG: NAD+ synthase [Ilumatobacteraceae bacterium]